MFGRNKAPEEPWARITIGVLQGPDGRFENIELSGSAQVVGRMLRQAIVGVGGMPEEVGRVLTEQLQAGPGLVVGVGQRVEHEDALSLLGEGIQTALQKAGSYRWPRGMLDAIGHMMDSDEWREVLEHLVAGLGEAGVVLVRSNGART